MSSDTIYTPVFTSVYSDGGGLEPIPGSLYITGVSVEDRSRHTARWERECTDVTFAVIAEQSASHVTFRVGVTERGIMLRSAREVASLLHGKSYTAIYLDITGLEHDVWAPLLRGMYVGTTRSYCVYVEPGDYRFSDVPTEVRIFDLSEEIGGIRPLPGFVSLADDGEDFLFVPLLGFEGARLTYMIEQAQPNQRRICPVVGVPGFRPEYPFYSYIGNGLPLRETRAWQNVRFAPANCPFSLYLLLDRVSRENSGRFLKVAPIGTKPHAVGAVLYYLKNPSATEILYDHPVRREHRTVGTSRICLYDVSSFLRVA